MRPHEPQTLPPGGAESLANQSYEDALAEARERTLALVQPVAEEDLDRVHDPLMSPLVWDLGHIAAFEDLWLCQRLGGLDPLEPELSIVYDASEIPRAERGDIDYLRRDDAVAFMAAVRERALGVLERDGGGPLWDMLVQHEHQHNETMLQTLQLAAPGTYAPERTRPGGEAAEDGMVVVGEGPFRMGFPGDGFTYDNERPAHDVHLAAFEIDRTPVTNAAFAEFVEDGGYARRSLWSEAGWEWRTREAVTRPLYWTADGEERRFDRIEPLEPGLPVMHVSWYEADAFARWREARLPTEAEWEKAAAIHGKGHGHLDQLDFGPGTAGPYLGDCWEWTASCFEGYPGFQAFPYREYSEVFFGTEYRVLRGASWATRPSVARATFRNWDFPERRQIFAGFRCAR